jgi:hypothetical protein
VQTVQGRTFFRRGTRWIDGELALAPSEPTPQRSVVFGTPEHAQLVEELRAQGCVGQVSLEGEILLRHRGETVLVTPQSK